jgi:hypothetical protein
LHCCKERREKEDRVSKFHQKEDLIVRPGVDGTSSHFTRQKSDVGKGPPRFPVREVMLEDFESSSNNIRPAGPSSPAKKTHRNN